MYDKTRPHKILRAFVVQYLDDLQPSIETIVLDESAPKGGTRIEYVEMDKDV